MHAEGPQLSPSCFVNEPNSETVLCLQGSPFKADLSIAWATVPTLSNFSLKDLGY